MAINPEKRMRIEEVVKEILDSRLAKFPADASANRNAPFHEAFLSAFSEQLRHVNVPTGYLVALASWMHGLNTSLGTGFENIAHIISGGLKRKFTAGYTLMVSTNQDATISMIMSGLKSGKRLPKVDEEDALLADKSRRLSKEKLQQALGFTADVYIETASSIECIELKSVRPNSGEGRGEKEKILYAKAALKRLNPDKTISFYIGFPFDPTSKTPTGHDKGRFMNHLIEFEKFFDPDEVLVASELWDHLSGSKNTMEQVLEITTKTVERFCSRVGCS